MKVESKVVELPIDANWNQKVLELQAEGWTILAGAKSILPVSRTMNDDGSVMMAPPPGNADMLGANVHVELDDKLVFILRNGKLYDQDGVTEVSEEERQRREEAAQKRREENYARKLAAASGVAAS